MAPNEEQYRHIKSSSAATPAVSDLELRAYAVMTQVFERSRYFARVAHNDATLNLEGRSYVHELMDAAHNIPDLIRQVRLGENGVWARNFLDQEIYRLECALEESSDLRLDRYFETTERPAPIHKRFLSYFGF